MLARETSAEERYYLASQWQLMRRKFTRHKLAIIGGVVLAIFYIAAIFCEFFAPYGMRERNPDRNYAPPQIPRFVDADGGFHVRPFVYGLTETRDPETWRTIYTLDRSQRFPLQLFVRGDPYRMWGIFQSDLHLFGVQGERVFLFGTDTLGRDLFSRTLYGARISLSIGLVGVALSFLLGCILGGISGYFGGAVDTFIQRVIEFLISIPTIPLWLALSAALPVGWPPVRVYFGIVVILSIVGWAGLARVVRGKLISVREEDFVRAAVIAGARDSAVIRRHLLPAFLSYLIINVTLSIPGMILGETALSFLGLGLRPPVVSWGVLLHDAQNVRAVAQNPWLLIPALFVIIGGLGIQLRGGRPARCRGPLQIALDESSEEEST